MQNPLSAALPYYEAIVNMVFTWDGGGSAATAVPVRWVRIGKFVCATIPFVAANTGTSSTGFNSDTTVPLWARPAASVVSYSARCRNNGTTDNTGPGQLFVTAAGAIQLSRFAGAAFTNSASAGIQSPSSVTFVLE